MNKSTESSTLSDLQMWRYVVKNIGISQDGDEILWTLEEARKFFGRKIGVILELGSAYGGSLLMFSQLLKKGGKIISVDPGIRGKLLKQELIRQKIPNIDLYFLKKKSEEFGTIRRIGRILRGERIDFLVVDSLHEYDQTRKEIEIYSSMMNCPSLIFVHDISMRHEERIKEFQKISTGDFWEEIKYNYSYLERCSKDRKHSFGAGLLFIQTES